jgi:hypothetical protein
VVEAVGSMVYMKSSLAPMTEQRKSADACVVVEERVEVVEWEAVY